MKKVLYTLAISFFSWLVLVPKALAQEDVFGSNVLGNEGIALGTKSVTEIAASIINIFLGLLGIIAVVLIIYGGFLWMTSKGNEEQVKKAKMLIINAVIGLSIISSAYVISRFLLNKLSDATGATGGGGSTIVYPDPHTFCCESGQTELEICRIRPMSGGTVGSYANIRGCNFGSDMGTVTFDGVVAEVVSCGGSDPLWDDRKIIVKVPTVGIGSSVVEVTDNNTPSNVDTGSFVVHDGAPGLNIASITPERGAVDQSVEICGINFEDFVVGSSSVAMTAHNGSAEFQQFLTIDSWTEDPDGDIIDTTIHSQAISSDIIVTNASGSSDEMYFLVDCSTDSDCVSGCCSDDVCSMPDACIESTGSGPHITSLSPDNGAANNLITVFGSGFGDDPGYVRFTGPSALLNGLSPDTLNADCTNDYWLDDHIIIGVPAGVIDGEVDVVTDGGDTSNTEWFDANSINRAGICLADPDQGIYDDLIDIHGINFGAASTVDFGDADANMTYTNSFNISSNVPLIQGLISLTVDTDGDDTTTNDISNPYLFLATDLAGGLPIISNISPLSGPIDEYVTIMGFNFGYYVPSVSDVIFTDGTNEYSASFDFPAVCGNNFWQESSIVAKVPSAVSISTNYDIYIIRGNDGEESDTYDDSFNITSGIPSPGICSMQPNNGPEGMEVNFYGEYFGSYTLGSSDILFRQNESADLSSVIWNDNQVLNSKVPTDAMSGEAEIIRNDSVDSNNMMFNVGSCPNDAYCNSSGLGLYCCPGNTGDYCSNDCSLGSNSCQYSWDITTGVGPVDPEIPFGLKFNYTCSNDIQTPSPWPDGLDSYKSEDASLDVNLVALFTRDVDDSDLFDANNFQVFTCNTGASDPFNSNECSDSSVSGDITIINHSSDSEGLVFNPISDLSANTWYMVEMGTFHAASGPEMWSPADETPNFEWHFKTSDIMCVVDSVIVSPQGYDANLYINETRDFNASPYASNCNMCGGSYDYSWWLGTNNTYASIAPATNSSVNIGYTTLTAGPNSTENLTPDNYVGITVENTNYSVTDSSQSIIMAPRLEILGYGPDCEDSCDSGEVWIEFNTEISPSTLNNNNFAIYSCTDISCATHDSDNLTSFTSQVTIPSAYHVSLSHNLLPIDKYYHVVISSDVTNIYGYTLDGGEFSWTFGVGSDNCIVDSVAVSPIYESIYIDDTIDYLAQAYSNTSTCYPGGQAIQCDLTTSCIWSWNSSDSSVASVVDHNLSNTTATGILVGNNIHITAEAVQSGVTQSGFGELNVLTPVIDPGITYDNPRVENIQPNGSNECPNAAISMDFTETMDRNSLRNYVKIYYDNAGVMEEVSGSYIFQDLDGDLDGDLETQLIFNPSSYLNISSNYTIFIDENVESIHGLTLDITGSIVGNINGNRGVIEDFDTAVDLCEINYALIDPSPYTYYESYFDNDFVAEVYDVAGTLLNLTPIPIPPPVFSWDIHDTNLVVLTNNNAQTVTGTSQNDNGQTVLTVNIDGGSLGSASASANIDLFFCENPWPNDADGYFDFYSDFDTFEFSYDMHFKTRYCKDYAEGVFENVVTAGFEDDSVGALPINWESHSQSHASVGISSLDAMTGAHSLLMHQDPNEAYPGTCIQDACEGDGTGSWPSSYRHASNCTWSSNQCTIGGNVYNEGNSFTWPYNNTTMWTRATYQVGNLNWKYGEEYVIHFYYKGDIDTYIRPRLSYALGWGSQCVSYDSSSASTYCSAYGGPYEECADQSGYCCLHEPYQTRCYTEQILGYDIPAGTYNDWTLYEGYFIFDDEVARLLDSSGNLHFELGYSLGYTPTDADGSNFYVDDFTISGETLPALPDEPLQIPIDPLTDPNLLQDFMFPIVNLDTDNFVGIRVYSNEEHLSAYDWYNTYAPNPGEAGAEILIDGYPAYRAGNTVYISSVNIEDASDPNSNLHTNIYLLAYNIGANAATINIFNQLLEELEFNTNIARDDNICVDNDHLYCASDFDCPGEDVCESNSLELRRDLERLGDLISIQNSLYSYGLDHRYCSMHPTNPCITNSDCLAGETCKDNYPLLPAGSFIRGLSSSKWPSWSDELGTVLGISLPVDPINLFNGYTEGADPNTCWNEVSGEFICPVNSLIYLYDNTNNNPFDYTLVSDFEYNEGGITFSNNLSPEGGVNNIPYLSSNLVAYCNGTPIFSGGGTVAEYCGNGTIDDYDDDGTDDEECEPGDYLDNGCTGDLGWWNQQRVGCNPAGTVDAGGNLIECTWYEPTAVECGGYCGDETFQGGYELCEILPGPIEFYNGVTYHCENLGPYSCDSDPNNIDDSCQPICTNGLPASACLDNVYTPLAEECDPTGTPNGLEGWDCTENGDISCTNSCFRECTIGTAYEGVCGDGITQDASYSPPGLEECDYYNYSIPLPDDSSIDNAYGCNNDCTFTNEYCGDATYQYSFQELCDYDLATSDYNIGWPMPAPHETIGNPESQYQCRTNTGSDPIELRCSKTAGGYCGDNISQDGTNDPYGNPTIDADERCDGSDYSFPNPGISDINNQYQCAQNCEITTGGYCGNGDIDSYGADEELCDGVNYPSRPTPQESSPSRRYECQTTGTQKCEISAGGYCGDGGPAETTYGETCEILGWSIPSPPKYSNEHNQYQCDMCINTGGYCGDGIIQDGTLETFNGYEACDTGVPTTLKLEKKVEIIIPFDMSGSMNAAALAICNALITVNNRLSIDSDITYKLHIMPLDSGDDVWATGNVYSNLISNCSALYETEDVDYFNFWDNTTNNININLEWADESDPGYCYGESIDRTEHTAYAMKVLAEDYNWLAGYQRVLIPITDEGMWCGDAINDYDDYIIGTNTYDAADGVAGAHVEGLVEAVEACNAANPPVHINPIWLSPSKTLGANAARNIAIDTGGLYIENTQAEVQDNTSVIAGLWADNIEEVLDAAFCDGDRDGYMDCTLP